MFYQSEFSADLSNWTPYNLYRAYGMFLESKVTEPYWTDSSLSSVKRVDAIKQYIEDLKFANINSLKNQLNKELENSIKNKNSKKMKL